MRSPNGNTGLVPLNYIHNPASGTAAANTTTTTTTAASTAGSHSNHKPHPQNGEEGEVRMPSHLQCINTTYTYQQQLFVYMYLYGIFRMLQTNDCHHNRSVHHCTVPTHVDLSSSRHVCGVYV